MLSVQFFLTPVHRAILISCILCSVWQARLCVMLLQYLLNTTSRLYPIQILTSTLSNLVTMYTGAVICVLPNKLYLSLQTVVTVC